MNDVLKYLTNYVKLVHLLALNKLIKIFDNTKEKALF
jgi:hypothetical protein